MEVVFAVADAALLARTAAARRKNDRRPGMARGRIDATDSGFPHAAADAMPTGRPPAAPPPIVRGDHDD
ncbi:hypothetical protein [Burkholderia pseudomultivorans]|uniref:hypothetical protein n=1 Tax=Burkholderia pseudomultivorans TaxID=1207504 RepID=UPI00158E96E6|nr:hypothetical protein [Burkholderia pseudomultivorans]